MTLQNSSDRYDHDMTADNFLCWLRTRDLYHRPRYMPNLVIDFLGERGYDVTDACADTVTLRDCCGCSHVRMLPLTLSAALRDAMEFSTSVRNLIHNMETRL